MQKAGDAGDAIFATKKIGCAIFLVLHVFARVFLGSNKRAISCFFVTLPRPRESRKQAEIDKWLLEREPAKK